MGHDLAGWPPRSVGVKEGRSTAFVASTTMRPLQSDIELTASGTAGNGTARITMSALAASLTVTAFTFEPSLRTMSFSELGPRLLASETSKEIQNMPFLFAEGMFGANQGAEFSGVPTNCKVSQCSMAFPSASILYTSTPAIPVSFGSSLNRFRKFT